MMRASLLALSMLVLPACSAMPAEIADAGPTCPNDLPESCPSPAPSFDASVFAIFQRRCVICHEPGGQMPGAPLMNYGEISARISTVETKIYSCLMPPDGGMAMPTTPLTPEERKEVLDWLVCGHPNN
jgi:hypothetical protein